MFKKQAVTGVSGTVSEGTTVVNNFINKCRFSKGLNVSLAVDDYRVNVREECGQTWT